MDTNTIQNLLFSDGMNDLANMLYVDLKFFRTQAQKSGFDEEAYIAAVKKVPIWTPQQLENYLYFIKGLIV